MVRIPLYWLITVPYLFLAALISEGDSDFFTSLLDVTSRISGNGSSGDIEFSDLVLLTSLFFFVLSIVVDLCFRAIGLNKGYEFIYVLKKIVLIVGYVLLGAVVAVQSDDILGGVVVSGLFLIGSLFILFMEKVLYRLFSDSFKGEPAKISR